MRQQADHLRQQGGVYGTSQTEAVPESGESRHQRSTRIAAIAIFLISIEVCLRFTPPGLEHWHYAFHRLYYLAIIGGGLSFGWPGGLLTAVISSAFYLLHTQDTDSPDARNTLDRYLETMVFGLVGILAGVLSDRERKQRDMAESARRQLEVVYQELKDNVEHVKRAARMSALGHLSAGLAHEIRNPLAGIEGAVSIVQDQTQAAHPSREFLDIIQKECRRLNRLVTDFLDFARPRTPEMDVVDVVKLIDSVVLIVEQTAARRDVRFEREIEEKLPLVHGDSEQLKQVLLNLVLNAVQAVPPGGLIRVIAGAKQGNTLVVTVWDNGPGIPAEAVDSIYDPFFTTKPTGTGLGLPVAYQIAHQHGGDLSLVHNDPSGVAFRFTLPVNRTATT
jgi:two-component system, NtrC family, sensor histidine kinase HydH